MRDEIFNGGRYIPTREENVMVARVEREVLLKLKGTDLYVEADGYKHQEIEEMGLLENQCFNKDYYENGKFDHLSDGTKTFYEVVGFFNDKPTGYIGVTAINGKLVSIDIFKDAHFKTLDRTIEICSREEAEKTSRPVSQRGHWEMAYPLDVQLDPTEIGEDPEWVRRCEENQREAERAREYAAEQRERWNMIEHMPRGRW